MLKFFNQVPDCQIQKIRQAGVLGKCLRQLFRICSGQLRLQIRKIRRNSL